MASPGSAVFVQHSQVRTASRKNVLGYDAGASGSLVGEYDGSGNLIQETVWLGDIPVATIRPNGSAVAIYYVETDQLDTPRAVIRPSDNAQMWTWYSVPFGSTVPNENPQGAGTFTYDLRLPGQIAGAWGSTFQNDDRDYDPAVGRYTESDPIGLQGGSYSTYSYGLGNPLSNADPTGLAPPVELDPYALPPGPFDFPTPGTPSNQAWAQNAASQMGQGVEDAVNAIRSICDSDCLEIEAQITKVAAELRWRYYEALIDRKLLYQL
ncbi:MAG: RHS repeat-associated core domain-containing protein, partial [Terriglobia bacterium]